jgi:hypothetical protein
MLTIVLALAVGVTLVGCVFLMGAIYLYVAQTAAPWQAAGITGLVAAGFAALLAAVPRIGRSRRTTTAASAPDDTGVARTASTAIEAALRNADLKAGDLVITGLVAGIVLGVASEFRRPARPTEPGHGR